MLCIAEIPYDQIILAIAIDILQLHGGMNAISFAEDVLFVFSVARWLEDDNRLCPLLF